MAQLVEARWPERVQGEPVPRVQVLPGPRFVRQGKQPRVRPACRQGQVLQPAQQVRQPREGRTVGKDRDVELA
eukprot:6271869-Lingulodinium_polyedra.AAC.1